MKHALIDDKFYICLAYVNRSNGSEYLHYYYGPFDTQGQADACRNIVDKLHVQSDVRTYNSIHTFPGRLKHGQQVERLRPVADVLAQTQRMIEEQEAGLAKLREIEKSIKPAVDAEAARELGAGI